MPLGLCSGMPSRLGQQCFRVGKNRQQLAQGGPFPAGEKIALQRSAWSMTQWGGGAGEARGRLPLAQLRSGDHSWTKRLGHVETEGATREPRGPTGRDMKGGQVFRRRAVVGRESS